MSENRERLAPFKEVLYQQHGLKVHEMLINLAKELFQQKDVDHLKIEFVQLVLRITI